MQVALIFISILAIFIAIEYIIYSINKDKYVSKKNLYVFDERSVELCNHIRNRVNTYYHKRLMIDGDKRFLAKMIKDLNSMASTLNEYEKEKMK